MTSRVIVVMQKTQTNTNKQTNTTNNKQPLYEPVINLNYKNLRIYLYVIIGGQY